MNKVEQFIKDNTNQCSNMVVYLDSDIVCSYAPWLTPEQALRAVEIEREEFINKACAYLDSIGHRYIIDAFRKYMEKE